VAVDGGGVVRGRRGTRSPGATEPTMVRNFRNDDEGKKVMTADGDMVGMIEKTAGSKAHVKADTNLSSAIRNRLGWTDESIDTYELPKASVDKITDDEVHLQQNL
jgi:hypothetical protein